MNELIDNVDDKEKFIQFLNALAADYKRNPSSWANQTISDFIEQMAGWMEDYAVCPNNDIDWANVNYKTFAKILYMGKLYE